MNEKMKLYKQNKVTTDRTDIIYTGNTPLLFYPRHDTLLKNMSLSVALGRFHTCIVFSAHTSLYVAPLIITADNCANRETSLTNVTKELVQIKQNTPVLQLWFFKRAFVTDLQNMTTGTRA